MLLGTYTLHDGDQNLGHGRDVIAFRRDGVAGLLGSRPTWSHPGSPRHRLQVVVRKGQLVHHLLVVVADRTCVLTLTLADLYR